MIIKERVFMTSEEIFNLDREYIANTYSRAPAAIVKGKGAVCEDAEGKKYIDMGSGIGVNIFGYCDDEWIKAVESQLETLTHTSNIYYTEPGVKLAKALCEKSGMKKVFFGNSGAEANECAIKTARKYSLDKYNDPSRNVIITLNKSFHGRTLATLTATGQAVFHKTFGPFPEGFRYLDPFKPEQIKELNSDNKACAVLCELVQGEGGVNVIDKKTVEYIYNYCYENDLLFMVDEVQTGNGRTGKMYCYQHYGIIPDVVSTAKGLGGGLPIGACLFGDKTKDTLTPGSHGSTFGMNPVVAAGALNVVSRIDDKLLSDVTRKGEYIKQRASKFENLKAVSGIGLMVGIESSKRTSSEISKICLENGVLTLTAYEKLRLLPPLTISDEELKQAMDVIEEAFKK